MDKKVIQCFAAFLLVLSCLKYVLSTDTNDDILYLTCYRGFDPNRGSTLYSAPLDVDNVHRLHFSKLLEADGCKFLGVTHIEDTDEFYITKENYSSSTEEIVKCIANDCTTTESVLGGLTSPRQVKIFANMMYWLDYGDRTISKANLDGTNVEVIMDSVPGDRSAYIEPAINEEEGRMYWTGNTYHYLYNADLYGNDELVESREFFSGAKYLEFDYEERKIYVSRSGIYGQLVRLDLDTLQTEAYIFNNEGAQMMDSTVTNKTHLMVLDWRRGLYLVRKDVRYPSQHFSIEMSGVEACSSFDGFLLLKDKNYTNPDTPTRPNVANTNPISDPEATATEKQIESTTNDVTTIYESSSIPSDRDFTEVADITSEDIHRHTSDPGFTTLDPDIQIYSYTSDQNVDTTYSDSQVTSKELTYDEDDNKQGKTFCIDDAPCNIVITDLSVGTCVKVESQTVTDENNKLISEIQFMTTKDYCSIGIDKVIDSALENIKAFKPRSNSTNTSLVEQLEFFGNDILRDLSALLKTRDYDDEQVTSDIIENAADIAQALSKFVPEGEQLNVSDTNFDVVAMRLSDDEIGREVVIDLESGNASNNNHTKKASVTITPDVLAKLPPGPKALTVTYFKNQLNLQDQGKPKELNNDSPVHTEIGSGIMSVRLGVNGSPYSVPLYFQLSLKKSTFPVQSHVQKETMCSFWDPKTLTYSTDGVSKWREEDNIVSCHSDHITSFAVLLQFTDLSAKISQMHQQTLVMLTNVLTCVSISSLLINIGLFMLFRTIRTAVRNIIHINLSASLLAAQLLFLIGVDLSANKILCTVIALALHYLYLCVFAWMLVEGLHLYFKIVKVYGAEKNRMPMYLGIGWGLPAPIVIISAGIRFTTYTSDDSCWLNTKNGIIWAFVGPACVVICINAALLAIIGRIVYKTSKDENDASTAKGLRTSVRGALVLTPLLGTTWIFGLLAIGDVAIVFQYLFVIFNSLQGFFIFMIYCIGNQEVRAVVKAQLARLELLDDKNDSTLPLNLLLNNVSTEASSSRLGEAHAVPIPIATIGNKEGNRSTSSNTVGGNGNNISSGAQGQVHASSKMPNVE